MADLKHLYTASFKDRPRFDGGGYVDYAQPTSNAQYLTYNPDTMSAQPSSNQGALGSVSLAPGSAPPASITNAELAGMSGQAGQAPETLNDNGTTSPGSSSSSSNSSSNSSQSGGALSSIMKALGIGGNLAAINAVAGLISAAGKYKQNQAAATLPSMPALPGGANSASAGYGPTGGYAFNNYNTGTPGGTASGVAGLGYAPRTAAPAQPTSSYYTYGQGPQQQFFQQVNPNGGTITPVTQAKAGGHITTPQRFDAGGMMTTGGNPMPGQVPQQGTPPPINMGRPAQPMQSGAPNLAARAMVPQRPMPQVTGQPPGAQPGRPAAASTMMQRMQAARAPQTRPFADGGAAPGALTQMSRHIQGPGDGTSDSIPARLANGEYVLSADVVSGLGNGDNGSGAKRLDAFVKNVRTHKAKNASKGKLPADAKPIHAYMGGQGE